MTTVKHYRHQDNAEAALKAAAAYFASVFAIGSVLGTIRILAIVPAVGLLAATLLELPLMLAASWYLGRWTSTRFEVPPVDSHRLLMGGTAFIFLMAGETMLGFAFGHSLKHHFDDLMQPAGLVGLSAQLMFALIPALLLRTRQKS